MGNKLVIISAPSGSGKTTIIKRLLESELPLVFSISATSRPKRAGETDGKDYYFLDTASFQQKIAAGEFLEWEEVYSGTYYGTLKQEVERIAQEGNHVLFDVDVVGGLKIKQQYGNRALSVFIKVPSVNELERRLRYRSTDSDEVIARRIAKARQELTYESKFDKVLVNDQLDQAVAKLYQILKKFFKQ